MIDVVSPLVRHRVETRESCDTLNALLIGEKGARKTTLASELCKLYSDKSQKLIYAKKAITATQ